MGRVPPRRWHHCRARHLGQFLCDALHVRLDRQAVLRLGHHRPHRGRARRSGHRRLPVGLQHHLCLLVHGRHLPVHHEVRIPCCCGHHEHHLLLLRRRDRQRQQAGAFQRSLRHHQDGGGHEPGQRGRGGWHRCSDDDDTPGPGPRGCRARLRHLDARAERPRAGHGASGLHPRDGHAGRRARARRQRRRGGGAAGDGARCGRRREPCSAGRQRAARVKGGGRS
mmetsp:Transcript_9153/g.24886  ORF Transcript_9153/g.24886 Transcript_9153/m.24886 type:complete len:224 (-) Transcript_9153:298-969(-)